MRKNVIKKSLAALLSIALVAGMTAIPEKASAAGVDTTGWKTSIALDFGPTGSDVNESSLMPKVFSDYPDSFTSTPANPAEVPVAGSGSMTYADTAVSDIYTDSEAPKTAQKIGFDKIMPSAVTTEGGNYFKDWVFSPNGEKYSFSVDLPVGQYYVYVYTGNKTKERNNTTIVNFNNETITETPLNYDQTSNGASQFYGATKTEVVYVVDVKDNGQGYGTLTANLYDDTIGNDTYAASHTYTISDALDENDTKGIDHFDFYEGTDAAISPASDSIVTARLNGIEIAPVASPVHAQDISSPESMSLEINSEASFKEQITGIKGCTDRIAYLSSNPDIASIDVYSGKITTHQMGEADIYAYNAYLNKYAVTKLTVTAETVISLDKSELSLTLDDNNSASAELTASFNEASSDVVEWTSNSADVTIGEASFTQGKTSTSKVTVTAKNPGTATITAKRTDTGKTATCTVNIKCPVKGIAIADKDGNVYDDSAKITIMEGETIDISAVITPDNATNKSVTYASSDKAIAAVSAKNDIGTISGKSVGEAVITVTSADNPEISDTITVSVLPVPVVSVAIADKDGNVYSDDAKLTVTQGSTIDISAVITPENATNKAVTYKSSNDAVATVTVTDGIATITGVSIGEAVITVTSEDRPELTDTITVSVTAVPSSNPPSGSNGGTVNPPQSPNDNAAVSSVTLSGKKATSLKVKKSVTFKAKASNTSVKKIKVKIKAGKKLIKVKKSAKKVKITALKKGKATIVVTVKAKDGTSKKFTRKITIK